MAFCTKCGAKLDDDAKFCTSCGAPVGDAEPKTEAAPAEEPKQENQQENSQQQANQAEPNGWEKFCSTENDITAEVDPADAKDNMIFGIFAYLFWLCLIPLLARKDSKFCQFHAKQGMFLAVLETIAIVIGFIPFIGGFLGWLLDLACTFFAVVGIYNVVTGKTRELPIIGKANFFK